MMILGVSQDYAQIRLQLQACVAKPGYQEELRRDDL